jgi:hypothetical protein
MDDVAQDTELDPRHLEELKERVRSSPFHRWARMELLSVVGGRGELAMDLQDHHFNPQRIVHGEAEVLHGTGRLLARATATFIVRPAPGAF